MRAFLPRRSWSLATLLVGTAVSLSCGGDGGSPSPTPTNVIVTPGADTLFALGATQPFTATVLDANGDPIDGATITWSSTAPSVVSVDPVSGVATALTNGSAQVKATSGALEGTAPITVAQVPTTVTIAPATGLFTFVGDTQTFTAQVLDAGGAPVVPVQRIWTLNDNGVAVIDSNGLARAKGPGIAMVTVVAIGPGGAKAGYAAVSATQPVATLLFRVEPHTVEAGEAIDPAIQAEVLDSGGAVVTGFSGAVTIGITAGPDGAVLHGTKTVNAVNGVVSYSGLWLDKAGQYGLNATAATLAPAASLGFDVTPSAPHHLRIITGPDDDTLPLMNAGQAIPLTGVVEDRFGNLTDSPGTPVVAEYLGGPAGGGLVGPGTSIDLGNGLRGFPATTIHKAGVGHLIRLVGPGLLPDTTRPFQVMPADPARLVMLNDPPISAGGIQYFADTLLIDIVDPFGNTAYAPSTAVSIIPYGWPYAAPQGRGQRVVDQETFEVSGSGPFRLPSFGFSRPGVTGYTLEAEGLLPDTAEVVMRRMLFRLDPFAGGNTTCVTAYNSLLCTGANTAGVIGVDPDSVAKDSVLIGPDLAVGGAPYTAVGGRHLCRVTYSGPYGVACRGANDEGQLGAVGPDRPEFAALPGLTGIWLITAGDAHTCALRADSTAVCWGANDHGQLGRGTTSPFETAPDTVLGGLKWKDLAAGDRHTCGVTTGGAAYCWGANGSGQLGDSTQVERTQPTALFGGGTWRDVVAGGAFSCGQKHDGYIFKINCWGDNSLGQVGVAGGGVRLIPTLPTFTPANQPYSLAAGGSHVCTAIEVQVICWGDNSRGAAGTGTIGGVALPTVAVLPNSAYGGVLAAGRSHTCVGSVPIPGFESFEANQIYCWGANDQGQLGDGTTTDRGMAVEMIR